MLELLERARYPAPRLVAFDAGRASRDARALLMTRLPGRVELRAEGHRRRGCARWRRRCRRSTAMPLARRAPVPSVLRPACASTMPRVVEAAEGVASGARPARGRAQPRTTPRFIHRDYHPANMLWSRGKLSGVVDWINACAGPPQVDVAHCRVNLVRLHGVDDRRTAFSARTRRHRGTSVADYDPYWDAIAAGGLGPGDGAARLPARRSACGLTDAGCARGWTRSRWRSPGGVDSRSTRRYRWPRMTRLTRSPLRCPPSLGGQAVIEGVMIRGPKGAAVCVRKPGRRDRLPHGARERRAAAARLPMLRGIAALGDTMTQGMRALIWSAQVAAGTRARGAERERRCA